ncbi:PAS domain-containing sensor histidine kinase [Ramlibacter sp. AN1015]|uniref:PAS domain-containing sensor histidine kinase n=1 Tax=Ramlibacter sp. AN1015 TaxID=3133428 RepID=UPI0030C233A8
MGSSLPPESALAARLARALKALDEAACGLAQTDAQGKLLYVNATLCRWLGRDADELVGRVRLQELLTMGGRIFHQTHWTPLLQMQGSISEVKLELVHRDGQRIPTVMNAVRREEEGVVVHHIAIYIARDRDAYERELVLARKRLEAAVAQARRLEDEAKDRALFAEQMIGIVSHDLRNPLSTIHTGAQLLARFDPAPQQQRVIERIQRAGERAHRLIGDLLDFTQARLGGGVSVSPRPMALHAQVAEAVEELRLAFLGRTLRHVQEGAGDVQADPDRIVQLLGNLVGNAMAYGRPDAPVTVRSLCARDRFILQVHNEGEPIPEELRARLFEPLSRGHSDASATRSVGLGLYIVSEIARAHGGQVQVESSAAAGTTFSVDVPQPLQAAGPAAGDPDPA